MSSAPQTPTAANATPEVQALLDAEREASRRIQQARQDRVQRLKDARAEAQADIENLKKSKHAEYEIFERSLLGDLEASVKEYGKETEVQLKEIKALGQEKSPEMVKLLLETVTRVEPHLHQNAALRQTKLRE